MAWGDFVQVVKAHSGFSPNISITITPAAGNSLIAFISTGTTNDTASPTCTDDVNDGGIGVWTQLGNWNTYPSIAAFYISDVEGFSTTVLAGWATTNTPFMVLIVIEVVGKIEKIDTTLIATGTAAAMSAGNLNPSTVPALLWSAFAKLFSTGNNATAGWTDHAFENDTVSVGSSVHTRKVSSGGSYAASAAGGSDGQTYLAMAASFKEPVSGPPPFVFPRHRRRLRAQLTR